MKIDMNLEERDRRYRLLRAMMQQEGYDTLILAGNAEATQRGYLRYVSDWRLWGGKGFAVLPLDDDPILVLGAGSQSHWARSVGWIDDVRAAGNILAELAGVIDGLRVSHGTIGIAGMNEAMLHGDVVALTQSVPSARFIDATTSVDGIMAVKSPAEIEEVRATYRYIRAAMDTFEEQLAPGKTERAVMAQAVRVLAEYGCHDGIAHLTNDALPFLRPPTDRTITADDIIKVSLEFAGPGGYWIELAAIFSFQPPPAQGQRYLETVMKAHEKSIQLLRPGTTGGELTRAIERTFLEDGWQIASRGLWDGHAIGQVVIRPPYGLADSTDTYQENMIINVHPGLIVQESPTDLPWGYFIQDNYIVGANGGIRLEEYNHDWRVLER